MNYLSNKNKIISSKKGFTLIELLVVVAIISLLSSIVFASLNSARAKARDARRKEDMLQIRTALELYYNDNSHYPSVTAWSGANTRGTQNFCGAANSTDYIDELTPNYISTLPIDPASPPAAGCTGYLYASNGTDYKLLDNTVSGLGGPESFPSQGQLFYDPQRALSTWMLTNKENLPSGGCAGSNWYPSAYPACW